MLTDSERLAVRSETDLRRAIVQALNLLPDIFAFPANVGAVTATYKGKKRFVRFAFPGLVDVIGWKSCIALPIKKLASAEVQQPREKYARWLAFEVKKPGQVPTMLARFIVNPQKRYLTVRGKALIRAEQQRAFLQQVRDAGGIAAVVTSVKEALDAMAGTFA